MNPTELATIYYQAAMIVGAGAKQSARAALFKAALELYNDDQTQLTRQVGTAAFRESLNWLQRLMGPVDCWFQYAGGYTSGRWLSTQDKCTLVLILLFMYEYFNEQQDTIADM